MPDSHALKNVRLIEEAAAKLPLEASVLAHQTPCLLKVTIQRPPFTVVVQGAFIVTTCSRGSTDLCKSLGADVCIDYRSQK